MQNTNTNDNKHNVKHKSHQKNQTRAQSEALQVFIEKLYNWSWNIDSAVLPLSMGPEELNPPPRIVENNPLQGTEHGVTMQTVIKKKSNYDVDAKHKHKWQQTQSRTQKPPEKPNQGTVRSTTCLHQRTIQVELKNWLCCATPYDGPWRD